MDSAVDLAVELRAMELRVRGRVQGVCFRDSTRREAQRLGLVGFVRNEPDGSVFLHAEGEEADLEKFLAWCRKGPPSAQVDRLERQDCSPHGSEEFIISY